MKTNYNDGNDDEDDNLMLVANMVDNDKVKK